MPAFGLVQLQSCYLGDTLHQGARFKNKGSPTVFQMGMRRNFISQRVRNLSNSLLKKSWRGKVIECTQGWDWKAFKWQRSQSVWENGARPRLDQPLSCSMAVQAWGMTDIYIFLSLTFPRIQEKFVFILVSCHVGKITQTKTGQWAVQTSGEWRSSCYLIAYTEFWTQIKFKWPDLCFQKSFFF